MTVDCELIGKAITAQIVRFDIPEPTATQHSVEDKYQLNMCLTPRPLNARAGYRERWGPHRLERLGDIFLLPPGEVLFVKGGSGRQASLICRLEPEAIHSIIGQELAWDDQHLASTLDIGSARIRALLFRLTEEVRHAGLASDRMLEFLGGELAIELGRLCLEVAEHPVTGGLAGWRLRLIDERLAGNPHAPTLQELAALCNISVRQLTRGFRVSRACSIGDYIEQRRMEAAKRLLMAGESVKTIAFTMGFASPSSFTFAFRRAVGSSPRQFRQRQSRAITAPPPA
ncbi:helix-turn-helix domain-containing protein [Novosphingobium album (ex Liu et al. 2023)]|nr:AraC family transcriptional regulator [Novosphingobium album (ex Liu et al. 2023)]